MGFFGSDKPGRDLRAPASTNASPAGEVVPFPAPPKPPPRPSGGRFSRAAFEKAITDYRRFLGGEDVASGDRAHIEFLRDGLTFRNLTFDFRIALSNRRLEFSLHFCNCRFLQVFDARWAQFDSLSIKDSVLEMEFMANASNVSGNIDLTGTTSKAQVDLAVARIQGDLVLVRSRLHYHPLGRSKDSVPDVRYGTALFCGGMQVHSVLMDNARCVGRVFLDASVLRGILKAGNVELRRFPDGEEIGEGRLDHIVLSATDTSITGAVILGDEGLLEGDATQTFKACGQVNLANSRIGGDLICTNGKFHSAFYKCSDDRFKKIANRRAADARIVMAALDASRAKIGGGVWLDRKFEAFGAVMFDGAEVGAAFTGSDAQINVALPNCEDRREALKSRHWVRVALSLDRAEIGTAIKLRSGFKTLGAVDLRNAVIKGDCDFQGGDFCGCWQIVPQPLDWQPEALIMSGATVEGSVFLVGKEEDGTRASSFSTSRRARRAIGYSTASRIRCSSPSRIRFSTLTAK